MEELFAIRDIYNLFDRRELIIMLCIILVAFYPLLFITQKVIEQTITKVTKGESYNKILNNHNIG